MLDLQDRRCHLSGVGHPTGLIRDRPAGQLRIRHESDRKDARWSGSVLDGALQDPSNLFDDRGLRQLFEIPDADETSSMLARVLPGGA